MHQLFRPDATILFIDFEVQRGRVVEDDLDIEV